MLIYILKRVLGGGLLLNYIVTLGYYIKQLGSWILDTIKASILYIAKALL